jgi:hypothetical protein
MSHEQRSLSRRTFLKQTAAISAGLISARGIYALIDQFNPPSLARTAVTTSTTRPNEQYHIDDLEIVTDNNVPVVVPPLYHDVITATLTLNNPSATQLFEAQQHFEQALQYVEDQLPNTPLGLNIVVGWGWPYFRNYLPDALVQSMMPVDNVYSALTGKREFALLDAIRFPSDRDEVRLEANHVVFFLRSDSQQILKNAEEALFDNTNSPAYLGSLLRVTSVRRGFVGRGFDGTNIAKELAQAANLPGADAIPSNSQLMMGFTSTQQAALAPGNLINFETLPNLTDQWPNGYFVGGTTMHLSHMFEDLGMWYGSFDYRARLHRMFNPRTNAQPNIVTLPNGEGQGSNVEQLIQDATSDGVLGHNATLQQGNRLNRDVTDNYGVRHNKATAISLRADFNTLDNTFAYSIYEDEMHEQKAAGLHFVSFTATSHQFHTLRLAMDGVMPDGTNLRNAPYNISDAANGINQLIRATHRQNFLVPPRLHRSFPLAELLEGVPRIFMPNVQA